MYPFLIVSKPFKCPLSSHKDWMAWIEEDSKGIMDDSSLLQKTIALVNQWRG